MALATRRRNPQAMPAHNSQLHKKSAASQWMCRYAYLAGICGLACLIQSIKMLLASRPHDLRLFTLGINNGIRAGDLLRLKISHVKYAKPGPPQVSPCDTWASRTRKCLKSLPMKSDWDIQNVSKCIEMYRNVSKWTKNIHLIA